MRMIRMIDLAGAGLVAGVLVSQPAVAQTRPAAPQNRTRSVALAPAPAPVAPETVSRTAEGAVTVRAVRIPEPLKIDGKLDERYYRDIPAIGDFVQQDPVEGAAETEKTEAWILFDDNNLYVSVRCWDSHPEREIANELRRDANGILQNDSISIAFDTFHDKRNSVFFQTTPIGAFRDVAITDEANVNVDWNAVWDVKTQRSSEGWTAEFVIPFKSLRYNADPVQTWGVNFRRVIRWKNEWTYLAPVPAYSAQRGIFLISLAATLVGLEAPPKALNLELKPYGISGVRTDLKANPAFDNRVDRNFGLDTKYGLSKSLTLDLTYNTDFAQVEDDTQQVNLTRFNQFFPERREFFLEGSGIFSFGPSGGGSGGGGSNNTPVMFFSRRIGLNNGRAVPIAGGGRVTGRAGATSIGMLNIQSKTDRPSKSEATNFSVVRLKRDVLKRSNVGVLYTRRDETALGSATTGQTVGVDGLYSLSTALNVNGFYAQTEKPGITRGNTSYLARFDYSADRYGLQVERLKVGENFNPEVGFLRRSDFLRSFLSARFSPRPARNHMKKVRRFIYQGNVEYIENNANRLAFREREGQFQIEFYNSDILNVDYTGDYEFVPKPFAIASSTLMVPAGGYAYRNLLTSYTFGTQRAVSGNVSYQQGSLYGGTKRTISLGNGRTELTSQFALEPSFSINWIDLPWGRLTTSVITERTTYTISPRMFVSALTQYASSSHTFSTNARFRWEYRPGSEMFVVYSDGRDTVPSGFPPIVNRAFIIKINRLFRL